MGARGCGQEFCLCGGLGSGRSLEYFNSLKMGDIRLTGFSETSYALFQGCLLRCLLGFPFDAVRHGLLFLGRDGLVP